MPGLLEGCAGRQWHSMGNAKDSRSQNGTRAAWSRLYHPSHIKIAIILPSLREGRVIWQPKPGGPCSGLLGVVMINPMFKALGRDWDCFPAQEVWGTQKEYSILVLCGHSWEWGWPLRGSGDTENEPLPQVLVLGYLSSHIQQGRKCVLSLLLFFL